MTEKIHISAILYVDPPWRNTAEMIHHREASQNEHDLFYGHIQTVIAWLRTWAAFKRQPAHNWMGVEDWIERPSNRPPCYCVATMWAEIID